MHGWVIFWIVSILHELEIKNMIDTLKSGSWSLTGNGQHLVYLKRTKITRPRYSNTLLILIELISQRPLTNVERVGYGWKMPIVAATIRLFSFYICKANVVFTWKECGYLDKQHSLWSKFRFNKPLWEDIPYPPPKDVMGSCINWSGEPSPVSSKEDYIIGLIQ
jgi:hypothetical protein